MGSEADTRTAVVTGASRGIGRALAIELVAVGFEVYGSGRDEAALEETKRLSARPEAFHPRPFDVRDEAAVDGFVAEPARLDLCVNNAAALHVAPLVETPLERVEEMLDVNVVGAFLVMRAAARRMLEAGRGRIVDIASVGAVEPLPGAAAYAGSKHALAGMSKTLAQELKLEGVQVTTVYPGSVATDIHGPEYSHEGFMEAAEVASTIVGALLGSGETVRISELHLQPASGIE